MSSSDDKHVIVQIRAHILGQNTDSNLEFHNSKLTFGNSFTFKFSVLSPKCEDNNYLKGFMFLKLKSLLASGKINKSLVIL
jgi:hypothetical protein